MGRAGHARAALRAVLRRPELRRVELAFLGFNAAEYGVWVAMLVYAYEQGGATTAGLVALAQLLPAAVFAPFAAGMADRHPPARILALGYALQAAATAATAILLVLEAPPAAAYAGAILAATAVTLTRPAQAALLPSLVKGPEQLTAANAVSGWAESSCVLAGPALAGVMLGLGGAGAAFGLFSVGLVGSTLLVAGLRVPSTASAELPDGYGIGQVRAGLRALAAVPGSASLVTVLATQYVLIGALDVLAVVLAIDVLELGSSAAGYLTAAFGAGGVAGAAVALTLVGRQSLVPGLLAGALTWGLAFVLIAAWQTAAGAFLLIAAGGAARSVLDVAGRTLLQRTAPPETIARVFGLLEGMLMLALALGSVIAPVLVEAWGPGTAFAAAGLFLPAVALLRLRSLVEVDALIQAPLAELAALRASPIFAPLPAPELEGLARSLVRLELDPGTPVVREGEVGDRFYLVVEGALTVSAEGQHLRDLGPGDGFGEIALLHDVPRTATVETRSAATLLCLERGPFLAAVTGHVGAREAARTLSAERLAHGGVLPKASDEALR